MDRWEVPAEVVAWLCEETGMPWPMVWRMKPRAHRNPLNGDDWLRLPIDVGHPDTALLIDRRLAAVLGVEGAWVSAGVRADPFSGRWQVIVQWESHQSVAWLPGVPEGVTDPAEARAWALCWLHERAMLELAIDGLVDRPRLYTPLRNGEPCEVPNE